MIDINDYKILFERKGKRLLFSWLIVLVFIIGGLIYINNSFKYYEYYSNVSEYQDNYLKMIVLIEDLEKITKNKEIKIKEELFAYEVKEISKENIFLNNNYYKEIKLLVKDVKLMENEVIDINIIIDKKSLIKYVFETVWR